MGLPIKGQCIPDVAEPMKDVQVGSGVLAEGCWGRGSGGRCSFVDTQRGAEQEAARRHCRKLGGGPTPEARSWFLRDLNTPASREVSGALSPPPRGDVTCLKAASLAHAWLGRRMDAAGKCPGECVCLVSVLSAVATRAEGGGGARV